jgi:hypothetical protein
MPVLYFVVSVTESPGDGREVAKALLIRVGSTQALSKRPSDTGNKFIAATTYEDAYLGYGVSAQIIHDKLQQGMTEMSQNFAKAFDSVH